MKDAAAPDGGADSDPVVFEERLLLGTGERPSIALRRSTFAAIMAELRKDPAIRTEMEAYYDRIAEREQQGLFAPPNPPPGFSRLYAIVARHHEHPNYVAGFIKDAFMKERGA